MIGNFSTSPYTFKINTLIERVIFAYFWTGKVLGTTYFRHWDKLWMGQWVKNLDLESKICFCLWHLSGGSSWIFMIAFICNKVFIVYKPMGRETGLVKCLKVFFFTFFFDSCCCFMLFLHWLLFGDKKAIPWDSWVFNVAIVNLFTIKSPGGPVSSKDDWDQPRIKPNFKQGFRV